jgi:hypothetical protein
MPSGPVGAGQPSRSKKLTYVLAKEMGAPVAPSTNEKTRCALAREVQASKGAAAQHSTENGQD